VFASPHQAPWERRVPSGTEAPVPVAPTSSATSFGVGLDSG